MRRRSILNRWSGALLSGAALLLMSWICPDELISSFGVDSVQAQGRPSTRKRKRRLPKKPLTGMVRVSRGSFTMGCDPRADPMCRPEETPAHTVTLGSFAIDRKEVPIHHYRGCVDSGYCTEPVAHDPEHSIFEGCLWGKKGFEQYPVNCIDWGQAYRYCTWAFKRLPSEAEWEKAARWTDARIYPWGSIRKPNCERVNMNERTEGGAGCGLDSPSDNPPNAGQSPYTALGMAGNLREWVWDIYDPTYYQHSPSKSPIGPKRIKAVTNNNTQPPRVVKGGSYNDRVASRFRVSRRNNYSPDYVSPTLGVRCVRDLK